jgi:hypothetical protein
MTTGGLTGEELETMGAWCDKLVLYKVFKKHQERYYLSKPFIYHMEQFIRFLENHPERAAKDDDAVQNMVISLLLYFAANRRLDQGQGQEEQGNMISFTYDELYAEMSPVFDKMNSDEFEELTRMAQVVVTHILLQGFAGEKGKR